MMAKCQITWDSYKKNICNGFSHLQQQEELVDMTLVAEGYLVKVHKALFAIASPYIKEVIQAAPCQHPIIFLTHLSHEMLGFIVEYVYTGEVLLPFRKLDDFIAAAKSLHISGIMNTMPQTKDIPTHIPTQQRAEPVTDSFQEDATPATNYAVTSTQPTMMPHLLINGKYPEVNTQNIVLSSDQNNCLTPQNSTNVEFFPEENHSEQLSTQNCQNVTYSKQYENFLNRSTRSLSINSIKNTKQCHKTLTENFAEPSIDETEEVENHSNDNNFDNCSERNEMDIECQIENNIKLQAPVEDFCINVEMPNEDTATPKITIQAGVLQNVTNDTNLPNVTQNNILDAQIVRNNVPNITINAGALENLPTISVSGDSCNFQTDKDSIKIEMVKDGRMEEKESISSTKESASSPLYMISCKGCLQMVLNRYIYNIHHKTQHGKRWRCIDYRHHHCPAFVDTIGEKIVTRKFLHNHRFHDYQILKRGSRYRVFESLEEAEQEITPAIRRESEVK